MITAVSMNCRTLAELREFVELTKDVSEDTLIRARCDLAKDRVAFRYGPTVKSIGVVVE